MRNNTNIHGNMAGCYSRSITNYSSNSFFQYRKLYGKF